MPRKSSRAPPGTESTFQVFPPSVVLNTLPRVHPAHATCALTALRLRQLDVDETDCDLNRGAAVDAENRRRSVILSAIAWTLALSELVRMMIDTRWPGMRTNTCLSPSPAPDSRSRGSPRY